MKSNELTSHQRYILRLIASEPDYKASGLQLSDANYLASLNILRHAGNLRYEITEEGNTLLQEDPIHVMPEPEIIE